MANTISPNMGLIVPGVGTEPGPTWANDLNSDLGILDQHNHSNGEGVQITTDGLNINTDLTMNSNNLTHVKTVNFDAQLASLPSIAPNLGAIYVAGNELYYNDESGNVVQITNTGSVNAGAGSITGLPSGTASASYSSGSQTFIWQSATNTAANMDNGSVTIREVLAGANGITIQSPGSLAADYSLTLLPNLPGTTSFLTIDNSGNLGTTPTALGITGSNIANNTIDRTKLTAVGQQISSSSGVQPIGFGPAYQPVTNNSITITTTGRPVMLMIQSANTTGSGIQISVGAGNVGFTFAFFNGATQLNADSVFLNSINVNYQASFHFLDTPAAGTYTYVFYALNNNAGHTLTITDIQLVAYEL